MIKTFESGVFAGYFTEKADGNFSYKRSDDPEKVRANFRALALALGADPCRIAGADQVHGTAVAAAGEGRLHFTETDALMTDEPGIILTTTHADCIPVQLFDGEHRAAASVHSGWKGTLNCISGEAVKAMAGRYGTDPAKLRAVIGPGICRDCFEVSDDVYSLFAPVFPDHIVPGRIPGKYNIDLKGIVQATLMQAGVPEENIEDTGICTCCENERFYSYRAGARIGAQVSVVFIKN